MRDGDQKNHANKLERALQLVDLGLSPYRASKEVGLKQPGGVYRALKQRRDKAAGRCSCCGAPVDMDGKYIPRTGD